MDISTPLPRPLSIADAGSLLLRPAEPVRLVRCPARRRTEVRVRQGRVWLTCEGRHEDVFLRAGEGWSVSGPARLHLNAENGQDALLEIRQLAP